MPTRRTNDDIVKFQKELLDANVWRSCLNCEEWHPSQRLCMKYKMLPPPEVIVHGCPEWLISIPF